YYVVDKRCGPEPVHMLSQEIKALSSDRPVFLLLFIRDGLSRDQVKRQKLLLKAADFSGSFLFCPAGVFDEEEELGHAVPYDHLDLGNERPEKREEVLGLERLDHLREEAHSHLHGGVVI